MTHFFHSVTLDDSLCKGCTNCIKRCPTEAIRVRDGIAHIIVERCIDCGECIRTCMNHAKTALTDGFDRLDGYKHKVALPPPAFFGLWRPNGEGSRAVSLLRKLGFDDVFEVAAAADIVAVATKYLLKHGKLPKPAISAACPAVIRLMQVRYPTLLGHLVPLEAPVEIAAHLARKRAMEATGLESKDIGVFFLTPCPAKVTAIKQPVGRSKSELDGAIAIQAVFGAIARLSAKEGEEFAPDATAAGILWGTAGGEAASIDAFAGLAVDGVHNVIGVLDEVERGRLFDTDYIEAQACTGGCLGGCLVSQDPFVSRLRLQSAALKYGAKEPLFSATGVMQLLDEGILGFDGPIEPRPVMKLDPNISKALAMMRELESTLQTLPGLDCGACGSPNCRALAEDIVRGVSAHQDCIFVLRERVKDLAEEMVLLARKLPISMGKGGARAVAQGGTKDEGR